MWDTSRPSGGTLYPTSWPGRRSKGLWAICRPGRGGCAAWSRSQRAGRFRTDGLGPRWAVPVTIVPVSVRAVIWLLPAAVTWLGADQVTPSAEVHSTGCLALAGPARPTAVKPLLVAVTAVTVPWPCGAL